MYLNKTDKGIREVVNELFDQYILDAFDSRKFFKGQ